MPADLPTPTQLRGQLLRKRRDAVEREHGATRRRSPATIISGAETGAAMELKGDSNP